MFACLIPTLQIHLFAAYVLAPKLEFLAKNARIRADVPTVAGALLTHCYLVPAVLAVLILLFEMLLRPMSRARLRVALAVAVLYNASVIIGVILFCLTALAAAVEPA